MLHIHNVAIIGGVPTFICDLAAAFPQFFHVSMYLNPREDRGAIQMLNNSGIRALHGQLNEATIKDIDPAVLVLHNISGASAEGQHPWGWLRQWPTIMWHHSKVRPTIPCDLHIFVSNYLKSMFNNLIESQFIKKYKVIPPCIQASKYQNVVRSKERTIGKIATPTKREKYPDVLLKVVELTNSKLVIPGGSTFYGANENVISLSPSWWRVASFMSEMNLFVYVNDVNFGPETWCRGVTEALASGIPVIAENRGGILEQITNGVNGYLVEPTDIYLIKARIEELFDNPQKAQAIGEAGRKWVKENADISRLKRDLSEDILGMVMVTVL